MRVKPDAPHRTGPRTHSWIEHPGVADASGCIRRTREYRISAIWVLASQVVDKQATKSWRVEEVVPGLVKVTEGQGIPTAVVAGQTDQNCDGTAGTDRRQARRE